MKLSLIKLALWLVVLLLITGGFVPAINENRKPDGSVREGLKNPQTPVPQTLQDKDSNVKNGNIPFSNRSLKGERSFHPIIQKAASRYDIDPALVKAIIITESDYNPHAVSKKGAKGLMQLMPVTARSLGVEDAFNPEQNIHAGVRYFKSLLKQFDGDVKLALATYNAGSSNVRHYNGIPPFKDTKRYLKKVYRYYEFYKKKG
ncbi:MAG: lytic transglycosylase domain-containing protein [Desulfatiglandales bacterium]|nr:lytic transglycosylase domain-containing protein [Desulfatiglandales bacterium]